MKIKLRFTGILAGLALTLLLANACATAAGNAQRSKEIYVLLENDTPAARTLSGNYLAGRFAQRHQDWTAAETYMNGAMAFDSANPQLQQKAFLLSLGAGNIPKAKALAEDIVAADNKADLALIFLASEALSRDDYTLALNYLEQLPQEGLGQYTRPLLTAWTLAGKGQKDEALKLLAAEADPEDPAYTFHAGLIEEMSGDMAAAANHYKKTVETGLTLHSAVIIGTFYQRYGAPKISAMIYDSLGRMYPFNPFSNSLSADKENLRPGVTRAAEGAAYALYDLAALLYERHAYDSAQIYANMVDMLLPDSPFTALMQGDIAALHKRYDAATARYDTVHQSSPLYWLSRMRIAEIYEINGKMEQAAAMLATLAEQPATRQRALVMLGDLYRRHENFSGALSAYDTALNDIKELTADHWPVIYARGMVLERLNNWPLAEQDLLKALSFQPDNPMILNFIGYSWVDKGINIDRAIDFIRRAVALRPNDGYILDSYGWALYRNGQSQEAAGWLEKAVTRIPDDTTILDHLGDVYWHIGRKAEAQFQWKRARDLSKDTGFRTVIQNKLQHGPAKTPAEAPRKEASL